ncbi:hypothetical protein QZH41_000524 [Actinostola sp. cb2023]|nr:hypothetical protein QZH41_000524 [Actinostola sp. cb2023]
MGDISKMYHRILIPEEDQHVHRFLWRELEIDREPDVYIKTVLTFGDKPAPAMAQIALRKTAQENKNDFPEAAEVLTKNTYMDDICDSVGTVSQAQQLTKDLDKVLESGGFNVKGWTSNKVIRGNADEEMKEAEEIKMLQVMPPRKRQRTRTSDAVEVDPSQAQVPPAVNGGSATGPSIDASSLADTICSAVRSALANHQQRETPGSERFKKIVTHPSGTTFLESTTWQTTSLGQNSYNIRKRNGLQKPRHAKIMTKMTESARK